MDRGDGWGWGASGVHPSQAGGPARPGPGGRRTGTGPRRLEGALTEDWEGAKMTKVRPRHGQSCNRASNCSSRAHESVNKTVVIWKRRNRGFLEQCGRNSNQCIPKGVDGIPFYSALV